MKPGLDVVIVTFNSGSVVGASLQSLHENETPGFEQRIFIVDNNSVDDTLGIVASISPLARLTRNPENVGFARAVNLGITQGQGDFILLLNPDARLEPEAISNLVSRLLSNDEVAAVGPAISGSARALSAGSFPTPWRMFVHFAGLSRLGATSRLFRGFQLVAGIDERRPLDVDWISGACFLVRRSAIADIGLLSERWFMYGEDIELCARLKDAGYRIVHEPRARVHHEPGQSSRATGPSVLWITALHDFYRLRYQPSRARDVWWSTVVGIGLLSRACLYLLVACARPSRAREQLAAAKRFFRYALAVRSRPVIA